MNSGPNLSKQLSNTFLRRGVWFGLLVLLVTNVPLFLSTRLNGDATYYDLQVQCINEGGVLYRDMLEPNFPGVVWIHMAVRFVAGWSSVALRMFDLCVLGGVVGLLAWSARRRERSSISVTCLTFSVCLFYLSLSAWSHCQRDMWMLLPALAALSLRDYSLAKVDDLTGTKSFWIAVAEGLCWGCAFWIKPHVAVPAVAVLFASVVWTGVTRRISAGIGGVFIGGALAGLVGSSWLIASGAWPHFWETLLEWNPEYLASKKNWNPWPRYVGLFQGFAPWSWAHLIAIPYSLGILIRVAGRQLLPRRSSVSTDATPLRFESLLCAMYLGWFAQSILMQHPFSYTHVPGVILAIAIVAGINWPAEWALAPKAVVAAVFAVALLSSHCTQLGRLANWKDCVTQGPTLASRATFQARPGPYWSYYPALIQFLREQNVRGTDVLVYSSMLVPLYRDLELRPPTRYVLTDVQRGFFRSRQDEIRDAIGASPHKYIVSDISETGLSPTQLEPSDLATGLPPDFPTRLLKRFPATQPVIFRSGWFVVHAARDSDGL
jgi:hypothetical protein